MRELNKASADVYEREAWTLKGVLMKTAAFFLAPSLEKLDEHSDWNDAALLWETIGADLHRLARA